MKTIERWIELNSHENGWGYVKPGQRPRHHRRELRLAKMIFGMEKDKKHWWLPILYKPRHLWEMQDAGVLIPEFIPLLPGQRLGDAVLEYEDYSVTLNEGFRIKLITRYPNDEDNITPEQFPAYWEAGRRREARATEKENGLKRFDSLNPK